MDVSYVNPFITSTLDTFKTMLNVEATPGKPTAKKEPFSIYDVSGIIGLAGDAQGSIAISFPKIVALKVVSALLGTELKVIGPELVDGIGEIANIITGNAKQFFNDYNLSISLPNVVVGKDHVLSGQKGIPTLVVPFNCPFGKFAIEVSLRTK